MTKRRTRTQKLKEDPIPFSSGAPAGRKFRFTDLFCGIGGFRLAFVDLFLAGFITFLLTLLGFFCLILPGLYLAVAWMFTSILVIGVRESARFNAVMVSIKLAAILFFGGFSSDPDFASIGYGFGTNWLIMAALAMLMPLVFYATRHLRLDNAVGQFSYPIYISHFYFISFFADRLRTSPLGFGPSVVLTTLAFSAVGVSGGRDPRSSAWLTALKAIGAVSPSSSSPLGNFPQSAP